MSSVISAVGSTSAAAGITPGACPSAADKCVYMTLDNQVSYDGTETAYRFTFRNDAQTQSLDYVELTPPAGVTIVSTSPTSIITPSGAAVVRLGLAPGATTYVSVVGTSSCGTVGGASWGIRPIQAENVAGGDSQNNFALDYASGAYLSDSFANCSLAFAAEPATGVTGAPISSVFGDPPLADGTTADSVSVVALDGQGNIMTGFDGTTTISLTADSPFPGSLGGPTTAQAAAGVASFSSIFLTTSGNANALTVSAPGFTPAVSTYFNDYNAIVACPTSSSLDCTTTTASPDSSISLTSDYAGGGSGLSLAVSAGRMPSYLNCQGGRSLVASDGVSVTLYQYYKAVIDKDQAQTGQLTVLVPAGGQDLTPTLCFEGVSPFVTANGALATTIEVGGATHYVGLLPACGQSEVLEPCISEPPVWDCGQLDALNPGGCTVTISYSAPVEDSSAIPVVPAT